MRRLLWELAAAANKFPRQWTRVVVYLLLIAVGLRFMAMVNVVLVAEEAYYWLYSQHLSLGYFDHPPMVAWEIGLGTWLFGNTEFGVRVVGALLMLGASGLMYLLGRMWFGRAAGLAAAVTLQVLPVYYGTGFIATMDSALVFFWLLGLAGLSMALKRGRTWGWYVWGVALGAAMLCKYTGVFLGAGTALALIGHPAWRRQLLTVHLYLAGILALVLFSPVVVWNAQHDWASFRFQFVDRFAQKTFQPEYFLRFVAYQLLLATPLLLAAALWLYTRLFRSPRRLLSPRWWLVVCFSLPLLLVMGYKCLRYGAHINWTLPVYLSLLPALAQVALARVRLFRSGAKAWRWLRLGYATVLVCLVLGAVTMVYLLTLQSRLKWIPNFGPWPELARAVENCEEQVEKKIGHEPLIIADGKYRLASVMAFYRAPMEEKIRASDQTTSQWILEGTGLGFPYWTDRDRWLKENCIIHLGDVQSVQTLTNYFAHVEVMNEPGLKPFPKYRIALCEGWLVHK